MAKTGRPRRYDFSELEPGQSKVLLGSAVGIQNAARVLGLRLGRKFRCRRDPGKESTTVTRVS